MVCGGLFLVLGLRPSPLGGVRPGLFFRAHPDQVLIYML